MGIKMAFKVGGIIKTKKHHACGGDCWEIVRIGADIKIKCLTCVRFLIVTVDKLNKMVKSYSDKEGQ